MPDELLDVQDRDRIDAREGLVEQHEPRLRRQRPRDLHPAALAPGQAVAAVVGEVRDVQLVQQPFEPAPAPVPVQPRARLEDRHDVLPHRQAAEDRRLLREVAEAHPGADVHGAARQFVPVEAHGARVAGDQADDHVEARRLARPVGSEQADDLPALHGEADVVDDGAAAVAFREPASGERGHRCSVRGPRVVAVPGGRGPGHRAPTAPGPSSARS